jgi:predicted dehydrogenase
MTLEPVSWGVLGVADIAVQKVIPAMLHSELSRVDAIASRTGDKAHAAARRFGIPRSYASYDALLDDPLIEAVYVPLPNHLHLEWTIAAARAGKHVLCEKPIALTSADAVRMIDACEEAGVKLMEAFMYRLHPLWRAAIDAVSSGRIGELRAVQSVFSYFNDDPDDIRNIVAAGGGALYDIGCYAVNLSRLLFESEPTEVYAAVHRDERFGTDILTSAVLDFDGRHATFVCSTQLEPVQRVEILGTDGRIVVEIPFNIPPDRPTRLDLVAGGDPPVAPHVEIVHIPIADPYAVQADGFSRAIRLDHPVPIPPIDAVANLRVIERLFEAAGGAA